MKSKILYIYIGILLAACSYPESPRPVAQKFLEAFQKHDFEEASKYGTKETAKLLQQLQRIEEVENDKMPLPEGVITIVSEEIAGNKATIYFKTESSGVEEKLMLKKVASPDDPEKMEWRVALSKTDVKLPFPVNGPAVPDSTDKTMF